MLRTIDISVMLPCSSPDCDHRRYVAVRSLSHTQMRPPCRHATTLVDWPTMSQMNRTTVKIHCSSPDPNYRVVVHRCDGNLAERLPVSIELSCKPFTCTVTATQTDDGCYHCTYTPDRPGFYRLEVTCKGIHLCGSPFSIQVTSYSQVLLVLDAHRSRLQHHDCSMPASSDH